MGSTDLVPKDEGESKSSGGLSLVPMIWAHLFLTGDVRQHRAWRERLEKIEQSEAVAQTSDPREKELLSRPAAWKKIRSFSYWAATFGLTAGLAWTTWLVWWYAVQLEFGWLRAAAYLLPIPLAWSVARDLFQKSVTSSMQALGPSPTIEQRARESIKGIGKSYLVGFSAAFTLVFLQGLISWFMTPAPTIWLELWLDLKDALYLAVYGGAVTASIGPLLAPKVPSSSGELPPGDSSGALRLPETS
ncbi:MAG: hypothetical protein HY815_23065 [Candidatus Riflebacteria bacterium]|nr:hypothetical protein [Candidatus Riflebacteria bacterium]